MTWDDVFPVGKEEINGVRVERFAVVGGAGALVPPLLGLAAGRPGRCLTRRGRAVDRPAGPGGAGAGRGGRPFATPTPWSSTPTSTTRRCGPSAGWLRPRSSTPPPTTSLRSTCRCSPRCSPRPTGSSSRRQPNGGWSRDCSRWRHSTSSSSGWGWTIPTRWRHRSDRPSGDPYLLCLGRVDRHKGSSLLASLFAAYKARHPGSLRLVFAGPVVDAPPVHPEIDVVGPVSEEQKWSLLAQGGGPGVALGLGGLLAGRRRVVERADAGAGQRRLSGHRRTLPTVGRRTELRGIRRVRGCGRPLVPRPGDCVAGSVSGVAATSTAGSGGPGSSTAMPPSSSRCRRRGLTAVQIPWPRGRGPALATIRTPRMLAPGRTCHTR